MPVAAWGRSVTRLAERRTPSLLILGMLTFVPRFAILVYQRRSILLPFTLGEKSDDIARTFLASGTFGFIPGHPSAYTQPLYSFFLIPLYWALGRSWTVVGVAQILVAIATAWIVYEIGRRHLSATAGLIAGVIVAVHPYSLWHDVHVNREILDGLLAALIFLFSLELLERRTAKLAVALGITFGVSILGNVRLTALPIVVGGLLLFYWRPSGRAAILLGTVAVACVVVLAPWVVRNRVQVGCFALTTDSRALWEANNPRTLAVLRRNSWIDNVPVPASFPPSAQDAGRMYRRHGRIVSVDECAQVKLYQHKVITFWKNHPGEKAQLAVQASRMLWNPVVSPPPTRSDAVGWVTSLRDSVEPIFIGAVFLLGIYGLFRVRRRFAVFSLAFLAYQWALAIVFVGATRYRVPWDFVAALLAGAAIVDLAERLAARRTRTPGGAG